jgi:predicted RecA/RadA family phage recombinase
MPAATNFTNEGRRLLYSNTSTAIAAFDVVVVNSGNTGMLGVAIEAIAATTGTGTIDVQVGARYTATKATGEAFTQGQILYWNTTTGLTGASTGNTYAGRAAVAAATADTTADFLLNQP